MRAFAREVRFREAGALGAETETKHVVDDVGSHATAAIGDLDHHGLRGTASPDANSPAGAALAATATGAPAYRIPGALTPMAGSLLAVSWPLMKKVGVPCSPRAAAPV